MHLDIKDMERTVDKIKAELHKEILKISKESHLAQLELNQKLSTNTDQLKNIKAHFDNFNLLVQKQQIDMESFNFKLEDNLY